MKERLVRLYRGWKNFESSVWYRVAQIGVIALSLGLMLRTLLSPLSQVASGDLHLDAIALLIGLLLTWAAFGMGTLAWAEIVQALQPEIPYLRAIEYHLLSVVTKYLPGVGWQQVSKAIQLHRGGVPVSRTWAPVSLELALLVLTGLATALQTLTFVHITIPRLQFGWEAYWGIALVVWILCATTPFVVRGLAQVTTPAGARRFVFHLYLAELFDLGGWLVFGAGLWFIGKGVAALPLQVLPYCVLALTVSMIVALVVIIVPNGYGIRELTMSTLLQAILPPPASITVALLSRVVLVMAEFLGVLPLLLISPRLWRK